MTIKLKLTSNNNFSVVFISFCHCIELEKLCKYNKNAQKFRIQFQIQLFNNVVFIPNALRLFDVLLYKTVRSTQKNTHKNIFACGIIFMQIWICMFVTSLHDAKTQIETTRKL